MKPPFTRYVVPAEIKLRLGMLLQHADRSSAIGLGIQIYLQKDNSIDELIHELQSFAEENPDHIGEVIGQEAMKLICPDR